METNLGDQVTTGTNLGDQLPQELTLVMKLPSTKTTGNCSTRCLLTSIRSPGYPLIVKSRYFSMKLLLVTLYTVL